LYFSGLGVNLSIPSRARIRLTVVGQKRNIQKGTATGWLSAKAEVGDIAAIFPNDRFAQLMMSAYYVPEADIAISLK